MSKFLKAFLGILSLFLFYNLIPSKVFAQTILFQDDFDDGNSIGWTVARNTCSSNWQMNGFTYGIIISSPCVTESIPIGLSIPPGSSYSFEVDITMSQSVNMDRNFVFKYQDSSNWYGIHTFGNNVYVQKVIGGTEYILANRLSYYTFQDDQTYHFKIDITPSQIRVYINGSLNNIVTDEPPFFPNSKAGLQASAGGVPSSEVWFDNVVVTELAPESTPTPTPTPTPTQSPTPTPSPTSTPTPLPNLNVPNIKQYWSPWNDDIYDQATSWSLYPTIERWGCALTSAAMVLQYHGHTWTNPDILNNWLISQPDGYLSNGLLNWLAVSRYTKTNSSLFSPALEYRRLPSENSLLINELENSRPAILKEPGHFVVAKSQTTDSFGINDPGYETRTTLAAYGNTFLALGSYRPTFTDLSYILLTLAADYEIEVFDSLGAKIEGFTFVDEPLADIYGSPSSTEPLKIFQFPAPLDGLYSVKITGSGTYTLNSYLYKEDGSAQTSSFAGLISEGQVDLLTVSIAEDSQLVSPQITIDSIIEDLNNSYSQGLILKKSIYTSLRKRLLTAKRLLVQGRVKIAKNLLTSINKQIQKQTPRFIKPVASEILRNNIQILISSL